MNFLLAETYRRDGRHEEALIAIKKLTEAMPESFFFRFQLAQAYQQMGKHSIALKLFKTLSEDRPDFVMTQLAYAKSLTNSNRLTEAREVLEWSLNFKPGSTTLLATLGWTLVELKDYEALNELIDRLKNTSSVPPSIATHLAGWSAFQRNQLPQAVELLSQAMQLSPGNPELCYHLGKTLLANKQTRRGVNLLRQAMFFPETNDKYFEEVEGLIQ